MPASSALSMHASNTSTAITLPSRHSFTTLTAFV